MSEELEKRRLQEFEECDRGLVDDFQKGTELFVAIGQKLQRMRDGKLYKAGGHETFESYCKDRHDVSRAQAYRLMDSSEVRRQIPDLSPQGDKNWTGLDGESCTRTWASGVPGERIKVARRIIKEVEQKGASGEKVKLTAIARKHVDEAKGTDRHPPPKEDPMFDQVVCRWSGSILGIASLIKDVRREDLELFCQKNRAVAEQFAKALGRVVATWGPNPQAFAVALEALPLIRECSEIKDLPESILRHLSRIEKLLKGLPKGPTVNEALSLVQQSIKNIHRPDNLGQLYFLPIELLLERLFMPADARLKVPRDPEAD